MAASSFAEFITSRRRELELTLGDVAERVGVSTITVSNWSSGETKPKPENLVALANLLEVPADDLASMAGVSIKSAPEKAVNLMPPMAAAKEPDTESDELEEEPADTTGPVAALRGPDEAPEPEPEEPAAEEPTQTEPPAISQAVVEAAEELEPEPEEPAAEEPAEIEPPPISPAVVEAAEELEPEPEEQAAEEPAETEPGETTPEVAEAAEMPIPEPDLPDTGDAPDAIDSELAELIDEAAAAPEAEPELVAAVVAPEPAKAEPAKRKAVVRRPRRPAPAERPVTALPLTYVEDPKQLTRYRIRWALTIVILAIMFFVLLWASKELLSALSEVKQAVTPGGIGTS